MSPYMPYIQESVGDYLEKYGIHSMNGQLFTMDIHEMDNRIIFDWTSYVDWYYGTKIVGYSYHPIFEEDNSVAVMFERGDGSRFWVHIPDAYIEES